MNYWDPFGNRNSGEFPEGTPFEMRELSREPGEDLFGASGFMGQVPSFAKSENGGSLDVAITQDAQAKYVAMVEEPEEPAIDVSPTFPSAVSLLQRQPVGEETKDVITPIPGGKEPIQIPGISQLTNVVIDIISSNGVSLSLNEGIAVLNFLNNKLGGNIVNITNWTLAYCRQVASEIIGSFAPSITDSQVIWDLTYAIDGFKGSVIVALDYNDQLGVQQQTTVDTGGGVVDTGGGGGISVTVDELYGGGGGGGMVFGDEGYWPSTPPTYYTPPSAPPVVVEESKTPWGMIAVAGVIALLLLK